MSIWNKVLLGFIIFLSLPFFYLAARTLKTHQAWRSTTQAYEKALQETLDEQQALREGIQEGEQVKAGLRQVKAELYKAMLGRGRVWTKAALEGRPTAQGPDGSFEVLVTLDTPDHQISDKTVLYVFEEKLPLDGGRYLGEFKVDGVADKQIKLKPTRKMDKEEYDRVAGSASSWCIYERMPDDSHDLFAGMTEEESSVLPEALLTEIGKHGKPAAAGDPPDCVKDGKYVRPLLDFERAFSAQHVRRSELTDLNHAAKRDLETVKTALALAEAQQKVHEKDVADTKQDLAVMESERDAAKAHLAEVEKELADKEKSIQQMIAQIQTMVGEIARIQLEATRKINERTQAVMQAGAGK